MTFFQQLLRVRKRVVFRKPRGCIGLCEYGKGTKIYVSLKPRRVPVAQVYLHELIHDHRWKWTEKQVLYAERHLWRRLSNHERYLLYRKLFRHPYTSEESDE